MADVRAQPDGEARRMEHVRGVLARILPDRAPQGPRRICLCVLSAAVTLVVGCGSTKTTVATSAPTTGSQPAAPKAAPKATPVAAAPRRLAVGDTTTLTGVRGQKMAVTLLAVQDPAGSSNDTRPSDGTRFVVVRLRLANIGSVAFDDGPGMQSTLLSTVGQPATLLVSSGTCIGNDGTFSSGAQIAPGKAETGCIPFEVATDQKPGKFQYVVGAQTGEWTLAPSTQTPADTTPNPGSQLDGSPGGVAGQ